MFLDLSVERIVTYLFVDWVASVNLESLKCWLHSKQGNLKVTNEMNDILKQNR